MGTCDTSGEEISETEFLKSMYPTLDIMVEALAAARCKAKLTNHFIHWLKTTHPTQYVDFCDGLKSIDEELYRRLI